MKSIFRIITEMLFLSFFMVFQFFPPRVIAVSEDSTSDSPKAQKLYWFIPDGVRAEPDLFKIFEWAREGKLPNIKKMMDNGSYGYCIPVFPSHTPINFATLLTGSYPKTHGVADGPMHIEGRPLDKVAIGGFSSTAKKVPPIWINLEKSGKKVVLLSIPGSTPPELDEGITIRGRWGGWGADFHALNFQSERDLSERKKQGRSVRLFYFGPELTMYVDAKPAEGWNNIPASFSQPLEAKMKGWGTDIFAYIYDSVDDNKVDYNRIAFSLDKKNVIADLAQGQWSQWNPIQLKWGELDVNSDFKIKIIKLKKDELDDKVFFRVRYFYNNLNKYITKPPEVSDELVNNAGPMVDFADNFPAQLIYYPEDKETFKEEADMSFEWHTKAAKFILEKYRPDVFIQDIYTPNQMLSSRWWLGSIDPASKRYEMVDNDQRKDLWNEVLNMYKRLDDILGEYLKKADENTLIVLSSDHGMSPLNRLVHLNSLFAKEGLLKFTINEKTGEPVIDWENSKVIYLNMYNIYISPKGLAGKWTRASGAEYEELRNRVIKMLNNLEDEDGKKPVAAVVKWEDARKFYDLPTDRVGDLTVANKEGFGWNEEVNSGLTVFETPLITGYKQGILPNDTKAVWTPFVIMGPGVKKNYELKNPIKMVDQYPTIMQLMGMKIPDFVEGQKLEEIYEEKK
ncbi:MAG: alkaline phosphatase family protein [bacterium]|nr:alkaline phosphatase family protein [bacterium]